MKRILALALVLALVGCTTNQVLATLDAAVIASELAVTALAANGQISQENAAIVMSALSPIPDAASQIVAELASTDPDAIKAGKVAAITAGVVAGLQGLPPNVQVYVQAALAAWQKFLKAYPAPVAGPRTKTYTKFDEKRLGEIRLRAAGMSLAIASCKMKKGIPQ